MRRSELLRIVAPRFVAGIVMGWEICVIAAPILIWMRGKRKDEIVAYCERKGWRMEEL